MAGQRNTFQLGLVIIIGVGLTVFGLMFVSTRTFEERTPIVVRIPHNENVPRLKPGVPIICGPQKVGTVTGVRMVESVSDMDPTVQDFLYFEVRGEVNQSLGLREDCRISVEGSLLGDQGMLRIEDRGTSATPISADSPIIARSEGLSTTLDMISRELDSGNPDGILSQVKSQLDPNAPISLIAKVHRSIDHINAMTNNLSMAADPGSENGVLSRLNNIMDHLDSVSFALDQELHRGDGDVLLGKVHSGLDRLDLALSEVVGILQDNRPGIYATISNIEDVAEKVNTGILPTIESQLDTTDEAALLSKLHLALDRVNASLDDMNVISGKVRTVTTVGQHQAVAMIDNFKEASDHLKSVARTLREKPWKLIHKPDEKDTREAYVLDAVRGFANASETLDGALAQLTAVLEDQEGDVRSDEPSLVQARERLERAIEQFGAAEQKLWSQLEFE